MGSRITWIVFRKELKDIFRDKKTIIMGVLIPLIIFPVLYGIMGRSMTSSQKKVENNLNIAIKDRENSSLGKFLKQQKNIKLVDSGDITSDVKSGKILLGVEIPDNFDEAVSSEKASDVIITYDNGSQQSEIALGIITSYMEAYSKGIVTGRLAKRNISADILNPINIKETTSSKEKESAAKIMLSMILPLILTISCAVGPIPAATDLGAGEKERGTLEPLLTTQAGRMSLLAGKLLAITVMGIITNIAYLGGIVVSMKQGSAVFGEASGASISLDPMAILLIGVVAILATVAFAALELAISIYARSFKEAQTYLSPITILALIPSYSTFMLDGKNIDNVYFSIPLSNLICLMKEAIAGIYNPIHILTTFAWVLVYILVCVLFARFMFSREAVVFRT